MIIRIRNGTLMYIWHRGLSYRISTVYIIITQNQIKSKLTLLSKLLFHNKPHLLQGLNDLLPRMLRSENWKKNKYTFYVLMWRSEGKQWQKLVALKISDIYIQSKIIMMCTKIVCKHKELSQPKRCWKYTFVLISPLRKNPSTVFTVELLFYMFTVIKKKFFNQHLSISAIFFNQRSSIIAFFLL